MESELALADDHSAGMLAEVTRQVLNRQAQLKELANARMMQIKSGIGEIAAPAYRRDPCTPTNSPVQRAGQGSPRQSQVTYPPRVPPNRPR